MSKIIIDNNLIDLGMITYISQPKTTDFKCGGNISFFHINIIGSNKSIIIERRQRDSAQFMVDIKKMWDELTRRWSPSMLNFENITIGEAPIPPPDEEDDEYWGDGRRRCIWALPITI